MPETAVYAPGIPMWVDLGSPDVEASKRFYTEVFGWEAWTVPAPEAGGYTMFRLNGKEVAAVGPLMSEGQPPAWSTYISTDDIHATTAKIREAGGTVLMEPMGVMTAGKMAVYRDPTGAYFSVWQAGDHGGAGVVNQAGAMCWNELNTRDIKAAKSFYANVFGWAARSSEGDQPYTEWLREEKAIGGMSDMTGRVPGQVPPHWLTYFAVSDCAATLTKIKELGGQVMVGPIEIPQGQFAVVVDPHGAGFAVIQMKADA